MIFANKIRSTAPLRIAFGGGGTDIFNYSSTYGGFVLNSTISLRVEVTIDKNSEGNNSYFSMDSEQKISYQLVSEDFSKDTCFLLRKVHLILMEDYPELKKIPLSITSYSQVPYGSGLGTSSTICVALIQGLLHLIGIFLKPHELADYAYKIERNKLKILGGCQDHFAAAVGGFNFLEINKNEITANSLRINKNIVSELEMSTILAIGKMTRKSSEIIKDQTESLKNSRSEKTLNALHISKKIAQELKNSLLKQDLKNFFDISKRIWDVKKNFAPSIVPNSYDNLYHSLINLGAYSCKISGAGGGGFITIFVEPSKKKYLIDYLRQSNFEVYPFHFVRQGARSWTV